MTAHPGVDAATAAALSLSREALLARIAPTPTVHADAGAMADAMAARMLADAAEALAARGRCAFIIPVGPVGQYERLAAAGADLSGVTLFLMDEYLDPLGRWIAEDDPLSFRGHVRSRLIDRLPPAQRPRLVVPDPADPAAIGREIAAAGGVDVAYAGVGITGHLAFNDPEPGREDPDWFAALPTRVVALSPFTRLINGVTAAGGDMLRIPGLAVTVGMAEILAARRVRVWMHRDWQRAVIRRAFLGPVAGAFPASLLRRHPAVSLDVTDRVLDAALPGLA
jgi:glucosamine-6-phosphate deaminase